MLAGTIVWLLLGCLSAGLARRWRTERPRLTLYLWVWAIMSFVRALLDAGVTLGWCVAQASGWRRLVGKG